MNRVENILEQHPIAFISVKGTSHVLSEARVLQLSVTKLLQDRTKEHLELTINPGEEIDKNGFIFFQLRLNAMSLEQYPSFSDCWELIHEFLQGCALVGFNLTNYDIPLLSEEFGRMGVFFPEDNTTVIDTRTIFHRQEPKDLTAAYRFYCDSRMGTVQNARQETEAIERVFFSQMGRYKMLPDKPKGLTHYSYRERNYVDWAGMIYKDQNGRLRFDFGSRKDQLLDDHIGFVKWMIDGEFPYKTKQVLIEWHERKAKEQVEQIIDESKL